MEKNLLTGNDVDTLNAGLFPVSVFERHLLGILDRDTGETRTVALTSTVVTSTPVLAVEKIETDTGPVGYLLFNDHIATAESQLADAIQTLRDNKVTDLILDLRYNSGGYLFIASQLAYMISGLENPDETTFELLQFNDKHSLVNPVTKEINKPVPFISTGIGLSLESGVELPTLGLDRVFVITGADTCSASEAIINGLQGVGVEVLQIGLQTCGKPYGFYATDNCGTTYFSVQFQGVNAQGFGGYDFGFRPDLSNHEGNPTVLKGCPVHDNYERDLGDPNEVRLGTALLLRSENSCGFKPNAKAGANDPMEELEPLLLKSEFLRNRILDR